MRVCRCSFYNALWLYCISRCPCIMYATKVLTQNGFIYMIEWFKLYLNYIIPHYSVCYNSVDTSIFSVSYPDVVHVISFNMHTYIPTAINNIEPIIIKSLIVETRVPSMTVSHKLWKYIYVYDVTWLCENDMWAPRIVDLYFSCMICMNNRQ